MKAIEYEFLNSVLTVLSKDEYELEQFRWNPKGDDLYLGKMKPRETLVEVWSDTDVQIVRLIWV